MARSKRYPDAVQYGIDYASAVAEGRTAGGQWAKKAAARFVTDLKKAEIGQSRWIFEPEFAMRPIILAQLQPRPPENPAQPTRQRGAQRKHRNRAARRAHPEGPDPAGDCLLRPGS